MDEKSIQSEEFVEYSKWSKSNGLKIFVNMKDKLMSKESSEKEFDFRFLFFTL